jgi:hypothetical protein
VADPAIVGFDWSRVELTEHMTEAAAVVARCDVVFDFGPTARTTYEISVYASLKGGGDPYFAVGIDRSDPEGFRPSAGAATPEEALQLCLGNAGVHCRRRVKQRGE